MQRASISSRFSAMSLDMIVFGILWQAVSISLEKHLPEFSNLENQGLLCLLLSFLYFVYPTKASGQTLGKKLLSIKVVPSNSDREPLTWVQALLREVIGKTVSTIPLWMGFAWARFNQDRRAWHDYLSQTRVISLIWEEEKTILQKIQHLMLGILTIPLGVALTLGIVLYTSLPLDSIKEKIEAAGIQVGALTGSLGGGLHFSELSREDVGQSFSLGSVDVKFNLSALVYDQVFIIEKLTAEEGHIEVPADFSWQTVFVNLMALGQNQNQSMSLGAFKMGKLHLKKMSFEHDKKTVSYLEEFSLKNLELADKELQIGEIDFQIKGLTLKARNFKSAFGRMEIGDVTGGLTPEFLPLLKVPTDFHFKGSIGKNPKATTLDGGMMIDKIKFNYENEKITVAVEKLILNEMFKTSMPLEELDLKFSAAGENSLEMMSSLSVEYGIKLCGNEFTPDPEKGSVYSAPDRQFYFKMVPKPVPEVSKVIFSEQATMEELFSYELHGKKQIGPAFVSMQEMWADLCFKKPFSALVDMEKEQLKMYEKGSAPENLGAGLQSLLSKAVPITVTKPVEVEAKPPDPVASPQPKDILQIVMKDARQFLVAGNYAAAKAMLEAISISTTATPSERGSFYNLKGWVYLHSGQPTDAAQNFEIAFNARKDVRDVEGLIRAHEELNDEQEAHKWLEYLEAALKEEPHLKSQLSPNLQKKIFNEASEESHP